MPLTTSRCLSVLFVCACVLAFLRLPAAALDSSISLELGTAESDEDADGIGLSFKRDWEAQWFTAGNWYLSGQWELGASYWDGDRGRTGNDSLGDFHVTPVFQLLRKESDGFVPFVEFGVGAHVHTDDSIGDKDFDIPFAFGSHVGAGLRFGESASYELLYRFQHLSNAGLGDDNPGINFHLLQLGYRF